MGILGKDERGRTVYCKCEYYVDGETNYERTEHWTKENGYKITVFKGYPYHNDKEYYVTVEYKDKRYCSVGNGIGFDTEEEAWNFANKFVDGEYNLNLYVKEGEKNE